MGAPAPTRLQSNQATEGVNKGVKSGVTNYNDNIMESDHVDNELAQA
jgi:hypothetical protein